MFNAFSHAYIKPSFLYLPNSNLSFHIYLEISQGNSLKKAKMSFFSFFFYKIREQEGRWNRACGVRVEVGETG
jgi:hypothetical protein